MHYILTPTHFYDSLILPKVGCREYLKVHKYNRKNRPGGHAHEPFRDLIPALKAS